VKQLLQRETADFITPDLWLPNGPDLLILWITGYVEYCSSVFIGNLLQLNADELKRLLIEVWFDIQQSVTDQAIDQWRVHLDACFKAKGKHFENMLGPMMCCSTTVNNLL